MAKAAEPADGQADAEAGDGRAGPGREGLVDLYRQMVLVRMFEESCQRSFRKGAIGGYLHLYTGQEAVAADCIPDQGAPAVRGAVLGGLIDEYERAA